MNFIIPLDKLEEAMSKGLYNVVKDAMIIADEMIDKGSKVVIEKQEGNLKKPLEVFDNKADLHSWFEKFIDFKKD